MNNMNSKPIVILMKILLINVWQCMWKTDRKKYENNNNNNNSNNNGDVICVMAKKIIMKIVMNNGVMAIIWKWR
jgi:hypothetical protein